MLSYELMKEGRYSFLGEDIHRRAILIPFLFGLGGGDVAKMLSMLGVHGSTSIARNYSRNPKEIQTTIQHEYNKIITDGLKNEIVEILKCKIKDERSTEKNIQ